MQGEYLALSFVPAGTRAATSSAPEGGRRRRQWSSTHTVAMLTVAVLAVALRTMAILAIPIPTYGDAYDGDT